ncbi:MAG TPA: AAA family ATPase [Rhizomicrobium sp.]|jgi:cellulose biosynthesis protein BcsQ
MKTYAFHSYKGGSGRSLALLNFAAFLAGHKNKKVLMIDLDFDAPGLAAKLGLETKIRSGYVDYVIANFQDRVDGTRSEDRIDELRDCIIDASKKLTSIKLLPCGNPNLAGYWNQIESERFFRYFWSNPDPRHRDSPSWKSFEQDLRDIEIAAGNPDYCLVDCKTARGPVSVPLIAWADEIVEFLHCNRESVFGSLMIQKIVSTFCAPTLPRFTPVVTRVPQGYEKKKIRAQLREYCSLVDGSAASNISFPFADTHVLFEIREIEVGDKILLWRYGKDASVDRTSEARSPIEDVYIELFEALIHQPDAREAQRAETLLNLEAEDEVVEKVFKFFQSRGKLENKDRERNVALRVQTIVALLESLARSQRASLSHKGIPERRRSLLIREAFRRAGFNAGASFGREAITNPNVWEKKKVPARVQQRLDGWCKFDREAGFGELSAKYNSETTSGVVSFEGHFLEGAKDQTGIEFLRGYIEGVLGYLVGDGRARVRVKILRETEPNQLAFRRDS